MGGKNSGGMKEGQIIKLDGSVINDGKIEKSDFFNFLKMDLDDYSDIQLTREEAISFKNSVIRMTYGTSVAMPLKCYGQTCINKSCIFHKSGKFPLTRACPYEARMIEILTKSYMEDLDVDPEVRTEMVLVNQLVECDIIDYRANLGLSGGYDQEAGSLLKETVTETEHSTTSMLNLHPLLDAKMNAAKTRNKVLEFFAATRKEKYKKAAALKTSEDTDASNYMADMKETILKMQEGLSNKINDKIIIDSDWTEDDLG